MGCGASSFHPAEIAGGCGGSAGTHRGKRNPFRRRRAEQDTPSTSTKQLLDKNDVEPFTENNNARPSVSQPRLSMQPEANNARPSVSQPRLSVRLEAHPTPSKSEMQPPQPVKEVHQTPSETEKLAPEPAVVAEEEKCAGDVEVREVRNDDVAGQRKEDALFMMCPGSPSFRDYCVDRSSCVSNNDGVEVREGNGLNVNRQNSKDSKDQVGSETKRGGHWGFGQKKWTKLGNVYRAQFHRSVKG